MEGCGCFSTENGCCPDKFTPSPGPDEQVVFCLLTFDSCLLILDSILLTLDSCLPTLDYCLLTSDL